MELCTTTLNSVCLRAVCLRVNGNGCVPFNNNLAVLINLHKEVFLNAFIQRKCVGGGCQAVITQLCKCHLLGAVCPNNCSDGASGQ